MVSFGSYGHIFNLCIGATKWLMILLNIVIYNTDIRFMGIFTQLNYKPNSFHPYATLSITNIDLNATQLTLLHQHKLRKMSNAHTHVMAHMNWNDEWKDNERISHWKFHTWKIIISIYHHYFNSVEVLRNLMALRQSFTRGVFTHFEWNIHWGCSSFTT